VLHDRAREHAQGGHHRLHRGAFARAAHLSHLVEPHPQRVAHFGTQLEAQARSGGASPRITFLGALANAQVAAHLRRAALLAVPSVTGPNGDVEGLPISLLEAMSTGVPVVASEHGGIPEAVVDGETGYLVKERDVAHLSYRMSELLADDRLRREMSQAARARVLEKFDIRANTRALEAVYDELLAAAS